MTSVVTAAIVAIVGVCVGAALVWLLMRPRLSAAYEQGKGELRATLLVAEERIRALEADKVEAQAAQRVAETWRSELEETKAQNATLAERASRIASLENELVAAKKVHSASTSEVGDLRATVSRLTAELGSERAASAKLSRDLAEERAGRSSASQDLSAAQSQIAELTANLESEREQSQAKLTLLLEAKGQLVDQFKSLANDILEEKAKRFTEQNQTNLSQMLDPLKIKIAEFQEKVESAYVNESKDRSALGAQVRHLLELNQTLSADAKSLTRALIGSSKSQGSWGELVLERILEQAGLRNGEEYTAQESFQREEGGRSQPDIVISLPEGRHLVIDSKVSLTAYQEIDSSSDEEERDLALKRHLQSVRTHMSGLSARNYQTLYGITSLDFVIMFVPIEPAFMLAVTNDREIFADAWRKNVLVVSPSTLLFVIRTVAHLWRQEAQNRNAQEIAKRGAELYDRLVAFVAELETVGERLQQAQNSFNEARDKLIKNRGNVIRQAEMLKQLGVKPTKTMPPKVVEFSGDDEERALPTIEAKVETA